jgi:integrase
VRSLTDSDAARVLDAAAGRPAHQRLVLRLLLEYDVTAREICRITGGDVTADAVRVCDKRGVSRIVRLRGEAAADLAQLSSIGRDDQLAGAHSGTMRPDAIGRLLADAAKDAGLASRPSLHSPRRLADVRS